MKIINLSKEASQIQFTYDELLILQKSLLSVYQHFVDSDFKALILGISKENALKIAYIIGSLISQEHPETWLETDNKLISLIQVSKDRVILQLPYKSSLGLRSVLNQICHGLIPIQDFQLEIGFERETVDDIRKSLHLNVVEKMEEIRPERIVFSRFLELYKELNIEAVKLADFKDKISLSKNLCKLEMGNQWFFLLIGVCKQRPDMFGIIQILTKPASHSSPSFAKSSVQAIKYENLVDIIAYLELALASAFDDTDLKIFTLNLLNSSGGEPLLDIQVLSKLLNFNEKDSLKIRLRMYLETEEENKTYDYLEIKGTATASNIKSFITSIRHFLSELPRRK
jgi:hypothetical protein